MKCRIQQLPKSNNTNIGKSNRVMIGDKVYRVVFVSAKEHPEIFILNQSKLNSNHVLGGGIETNGI